MSDRPEGTEPEDSVEDVEPVVEESDEISIDEEVEQPQHDEGEPTELSVSVDAAADSPADEPPVAETPAEGPVDDALPLDPEDMADVSETHWGRRILLLALLLLGALYLVGWVFTGLRMPANASVGGVDVGGMSPAGARAEIKDKLLPNADKAVVLEHKGHRFALDPNDLQLELDAEASVEAAGGVRSFDPRDMWALLFGDRDNTDLVVHADDKTLGDAVDKIADTVDVEVIEAQITFPKAKPKARRPVAGLVALKDDTARAITGSWLVTDEPTPVPTAPVEPAVDQAGLDRAMVEIAKPAVGSPVKLHVGKRTYKLPVTGFAPALVIRVEEGQMVPFIDPKKLAKPLTDSTTGIGQKAVDARIDIVGGVPKIYPGKPGVGLQPREMAEKLIPVLTKTGNERALTIQAKAVNPDLTTEEARKLNVKEKMGEFTTYFPYAEYRNINQGRAAHLIDGTLLKPGEIFSMNSIVGERTAANGFVKGFVINGGVFREEQGGGVSQVATTLYNAGFFAGLEDVEHHPHHFYIDRYPVGREATVYWGALDMRFRNDTKNGVLVKSWVVPSTPSSNGAMHVEIWGTKVWDIQAGTSARRNFREPAKRYDSTDKCVPQSPIRGFDIDVFRYFIRNGQTVKTETDTAVYQAADTVICGEKPDAEQQDPSNAE